MQQKELSTVSWTVVWNPYSARQAEELQTCHQDNTESEGLHDTGLAKRRVGARICVTQTHDPHRWFFHLETYTVCLIVCGSFVYPTQRKLTPPLQRELAPPTP